jgi:hypothetical protein
MSDEKGDLKVLHFSELEVKIHREAKTTTSELCPIFKYFKSKKTCFTTP